MRDVTLLQYALVAATALAAGTMGGVAGYGTGLLMPLVLVPIVGAEAVVPIIGASALLTNASRVAAFYSEIDRRRALVVGLAAVPTCILGAYGFTALTGPGAAILIGSFLILMIPARLALKRLRAHLAGAPFGAAGALYGLLVGGTSGSGVILISILMAAGLNGRAVVATDAVISIMLSIVKTSTFQVFGAMPLSSWIMAALVGLSATPGAFIAKRLTEALPVRVHNTILDAAVMLGGLILIGQGLRAS